MDLTITSQSLPDADLLLAEDLAFHLGEREAYDLGAIEAVTSSRRPPDKVFACLQLDRREFFAGNIYKKFCRITETGILYDESKIPLKNMRVPLMINFDFPFLDPSIPYAYSLRDGRRYDYAAFYGTEKPIPVFQYYRRRGLAAIIHPLPGFQHYPSPWIPEISDPKTFLEKAPKIFWRGVLSGRIEFAGKLVGASKIVTDPAASDADKVSLLRQLGRFSICQDFLGSDIVDVGLVFTSTDQDFSAGVPYLEPLIRPYITIEQHLNYRYLLALDGNDYPSSWYWMLNTNSLVFRQESPWETFADNYFKPWIHFVPVAANGSDLNDKFFWCERNQTRCQEIIQNAGRAWSVLFDIGYQVKRRKALLEEYRRWIASRR